jgi:hypothetical protein
MLCEEGKSFNGVNNTQKKGKADMFFNRINTRTFFPFALPNQLIISRVIMQSKSLNYIINYKSRNYRINYVGALRSTTAGKLQSPTVT